VTDAPEQTGPIMTYEGQPFSMSHAAARRAELMSNKEYTDAARGGDVAKQQELAALRLMERGYQPGGPSAMPLDPGAVAQQMTERDQQIHEVKLDTFSKLVRMTPEMRAQYSRRLATAEQHDFATAERQRLLRDGAFRARVLANDADAVHRWISIVQVAAAPVAPADYPW